MKPDRLQMTVWRLRIACWIPKATNILVHSQYIIIIAFPLQRWLHERASVLRYTYSTLPVLLFNNSLPLLLVPKEFSGMSLTSYSPKISRHFPLSVFLNCPHLLSNCNILDVQIFDIITVERVIELNSKGSVLCCDAV